MNISEDVFTLPLQAFSTVSDTMDNSRCRELQSMMQNVKNRMLRRLLKGRVVKGQWKVSEPWRGRQLRLDCGERAGLRKEPRGQQGPLISMTHSLAPQRSQSGATLINTWSLQECEGKCLNVLKMCTTAGYTHSGSQATGMTLVCVWDQAGDRERERERTG